MSEVQTRSLSTLRRRNWRRAVVSPATDDDHSEPTTTTFKDSQSALFFFASASEDGDEARSSETLVAETGDSTAGSTMPDGPSSTGAPPAAESTAVETECADVAPRPQSVVATDNKNCSAREAIVRTSQISALVASTNCRWPETQLANQQCVEAYQAEGDSPSPKVMRGRSGRFVRAFPDLSETVINSYHCAYVGEVLFQGILYVTQNYFCFHSKLLGKKSVQIPVSSVTEIIKMNTAMIIPNAVGIFTASNKYVFGSLISRRNTYRQLIDVWKQSKHTGKLQQRHDVFNVALSKKGTLSERTSSSKSVDDLRSSEDSISDDEDDDDDDAETAASGRPTSTVSPKSPPAARLDGRDGGAASTMSGLDGVSRSRTDGSTDQPVLSSTSSTGSSKHRSRRSLTLCLILFTAVVMLLTFTAVYHAYKFIHLQSLVDAYANVIAADVKFADTIHRDAEIYRLRHDEHLSLVKRLRSSIEAHVRLLTKVNESLKTLCKITAESHESTPPSQSDATDHPADHPADPAVAAAAVV